MKLKKICSGSLAVLLLLGIPAQGLASGITATPSADAVTIQLDFGSEYADMEFGYEIIKPTGALTAPDEDDKATILKNYIQLSQEKTNSAGKAEVVFKADSVSGIYEMRAGWKKNKLSIEFPYININEVEAILNGLHDKPTTVADVTALFSTGDNEKLFNGCKIIGLDETDVYKNVFSDADLCTAVKKNDIYASFANRVTELEWQGDVSAKRSLVKNLFDEAVCQNAIIRFGKADKLKQFIEDYKKELGIANSDIYLKVYKDTKLCDATVQKKILSEIAGREWTDAEKADVPNTLEGVIFLTALSGTSVYGKIGEIIEASESFLKENGIDWEAYSKLENKQTVYREVAGKEADKNGNQFDGMASFKKYFNELIGGTEEDNEPIKRPPGGNGGGGGSSSKVSLPVPDAHLNIPAEIKKIDKFTDLGGVDWGIEAITYFVDKNILNGRSETEFAPNAVMKREEIAKLLSLAFNLPEKSMKNEFSDVDTNGWYYEYVMRVVAGELMNGYGEGFGIGASITREDLATVCYRALLGMRMKPDSESPVLEFSDADDIAPYAVDAVAFLSKRNVIEGMGDGTFNPKGKATRAQTAKIVYKVLMLAEEEIK